MAEYKKHLFIKVLHRQIYVSVRAKQRSQEEQGLILHFHVKTNEGEIVDKILVGKPLKSKTKSIKMK